MLSRVGVCLRERLSRRPFMAFDKRELKKSGTIPTFIQTLLNITYSTQCENGVIWYTLYIKITYAISNSKDYATIIPLCLGQQPN